MGPSSHGLLRGAPQQLGGDILTRGGVEQEELGRAAGGAVSQVRELGGERERVALAQEARGIGRKLNFLLGDELPGQLAGAQVAVVGQGQQLPARHGLRHLEFEHRIAVLIGAQGRLPQGRFAEIGAGGN